MLFDPPHAMFQLAEQYAMPHDRRMVLREGLANGHLTVLQIIQLAAVFMQQNVCSFRTRVCSVRIVVRVSRVVQISVCSLTVCATCKSNW